MTVTASHRDGPATGALVALTDPSRVTVAGDFHGQKGWSRHVLKAAARAASDVVVQVGDFGVWPDGQGVDFLNRTNLWCDRLGVPLLFVDGNHEDFEFLNAHLCDPITGLRVLRPWVFHAPRGLRWQWGQLTWMALGGAVSVDHDCRTRGLDWFPQEALTTGDVCRAVSGGDIDILIAHDAPAGVVIPGVDDRSTNPGWPAQRLAESDAHRQLLRSAVDATRPTHIFHGHYHTRYTADLTLPDGTVTAVHGLDRDGTMAKAYIHINLAELAASSLTRRAEDSGDTP